MLIGDTGFIAPDFERGKTIGVLHQLGKQVEPMEIALRFHSLKNYDSRNAGAYVSKAHS